MNAAFLRPIFLPALAALPQPPVPQRELGTCTVKPTAKQELGVFQPEWHPLYDKSSGREANW